MIDPLDGLGLVGIVLSVASIALSVRVLETAPERTIDLRRWWTVRLARRLLGRR